MLSEYRDILADRIFTPREHVEHQLKMSEEEKEMRRRYFTELFAKHDAVKGDEVVLH